MCNSSRELELALEPAQDYRVLGDERMNNLDRNRFGEVPVHGRPDGAHAA